MKPAKYLRGLFRQSDVRVDAKLDDRIINDAFSSFERPEPKTPATHSDLWRIIMRSKWAKLAAAIVIVAVLIQIVTWAVRESWPPGISTPR
jgi:hypothetical protein